MHQDIYSKANAGANASGGSSSHVQVGPCHTCWEMGHLKYTCPNIPRTYNGKYPLRDSNSTDSSSTSGANWQCISMGE